MDQQYQLDRNGRLAKQVSILRWFVPPMLMLFVFLYESNEHQITFMAMPGMEFLGEVFFVGVVGPSLVAVILTWITRNLRQLADAYKAIQCLNVELERRVAARTEELARANAELRELDHMKSDFVALVSHELRAPLTNIHGGIEMIMQEASISPSAGTKEILDVIYSEVERLMRLVSRILDISALEAGRVQLNMGTVILRPLIRQAIKQLGISEHSHPVELAMPAQIYPVVADEERLNDILCNLLQNAVKYSPEGGTIIIGATPVGDHLQVSIKDWGIGVAPEELRMLHTPFYRGSSSRNIQGYGLGLYFCSKLIEAQQGKLWLESSGVKGEGTTVYFTLPLDVGDPANDNHFAD